MPTVSDLSMDKTQDWGSNNSLTEKSYWKIDLTLEWIPIIL